jgi:hypothetical protein
MVNSKPPNKSPHDSAKCAGEGGQGNQVNDFGFSMVPEGRESFVLLFALCSWRFGRLPRRSSRKDCIG